MTQPIQIASAKPLETKEPTTFDHIRESVQRLFSSITIQRQPEAQQEEFALYFIERFFQNIESCELDPQTNEFTINLANEQKRNIGLFTLNIRKQVKGSFNFDEHKLSFDHKAITVECGCTTAYLHSISKNAQKHKLTIRGKYLGITKDKNVLIDTFVKTLESSLPK